MRRFWQYLCIAAVAAAAALPLSVGAVRADGMAKRDKVVVDAPWSWRGFYTGLHAGYGWGDADHSITGSTFWATGTGGSGTFSQDLEGLVVGSHSGYNFQSGSWVYGAEWSVTRGPLNDHNKVSPFYPISDRWAVDIDWYATLTGRLGYAFDRRLIYVKGGYAGGEVDSRVADSVFAFTGACIAGTCKAGEKEWHHGWTAGFGVAHAVLKNLVFGIEYNYVDLGKVDHSTATSGTAGTVLLNESVDVQFHTVTARFTIKLD